VVVGSSESAGKAPPDLRAFLKQPDVTVARCATSRAGLWKQPENLLQPRPKFATRAKFSQQRYRCGAGRFAGPLAPAAYDPGLPRGKDVYVEKPVSVTIAEAADGGTARKYQRVSVGTKQHSGVHFKKRWISYTAACWARSRWWGRALQQRLSGPVSAIRRTADPPAGSIGTSGWACAAVPSTPIAFGVAPTAGRPSATSGTTAGGVMTDMGVHAFDIIQWAMKAEAPLR